MTTPYSRLHLWLFLSPNPHRTRSSRLTLDLKVVETVRRISTITSCHLFNERTMSSAQNFLNRNLQFLMLCILCAQIHLLIYSTYTPLNNQITSSPSSQTNIITRILQSVLFSHLMIQYLLRYHRTRIVLRRASKIILNLSLFHVAGFALLFLPRDDGVGHRDNIKRLNAAVLEQTLRLM